MGSFLRDYQVLPRYIYKQKIIDNYTGKRLEEIPEEHRALVEQFRNYGYGLTQFEEVLQFCVDKERVPSDIKKLASEQTEEEKREQSLYSKWVKSEEKKISIFESSSLVNSCILAKIMLS